MKGEASIPRFNIIADAVNVLAHPPPPANSLQAGRCRWRYQIRSVRRPRCKQNGGGHGAGRVGTLGPSVERL